MSARVGRGASDDPSVRRLQAQLRAVERPRQRIPGDAVDGPGGARRAPFLGRGEKPGQKHQSGHAGSNAARREHRRFDVFHDFPQ